MTLRLRLAATIALLLAPIGVAAPAAAAGSPHVLHVPGDSATIQGAIDAAKPGDTVVVRAGTFTEEVVITKDLTLRGAGVDQTVITVPATMTPYGTHLPDGRDLLAIVRVAHGAHVRISDVTVRGPIPCGVEVTGVHALQGATLDLIHARVTGIQTDPSTCAPDDAAGRAIVYGTPSHIDVDGERGTVAFGRISRVLVDHYQHAGISVGGPDEGTPSRVTIDHDVVTGGWTIPTFQAGLWIAGHAVVQVTHDVITGNRCGGDGCGGDPILEGQGIGVFLLAVPAGTTIADNVIAGNEVGINQLFSPGCCRITGNVITHQRYFGVVIQDGDGATDGNRISDVPTGIAVVADAVDTTATSRHDRISRTSDPPVREIACCGYTAHAVVS